MKTISKKKINIDPMAEAKKGKYFKRYSKEAKERILLAVEIYNAREALGISQQELAKKAETTQKVISKIENGDVNMGYSLLNRIADVLCFNCESWSRVLKFSPPPAIIMPLSSSAENMKDSPNKIFKKEDLFKINKTSVARLIN